MKRFWLVMLSLGLVLAFSASAMAVDVKFSGSFYAAGMYQDKTSLVKDSASDNATAFYFQRLRVRTDFIVSPGLSLITRFDALERSWGADRATGNIGTAQGDPMSSGTTAENENIAFDLAYISYTSPIGMFNVGIMDDGAWGTVFGDTTAPLGRIQWAAQFGAFTTTAYIGKFYEGSETAKRPTVITQDRDVDMYVLAAIYSFKDGSAGLLGKYIRVAKTRDPGYGAFQQDIFILSPYVKAKIGPVSIQAEVLYGFGKYVDWDGSGTDMDLENLAAWVDG